MSESKPETAEMTAANGHLMVYQITGWDEDGYPRYSQWDAEHSPNCRCIGSEDAEPLHDW
ncbi:hypothetical protein [Streptomyces sp. UNOC14_S4]|uniref:hypothetical protein n=1 Tax=Streptomyces sp. UNOC14_S4 TaxID=2872340 RepID=UPI001E4C025B|nr:hypothetical protein [Streptomyces sp. UNOC14_S4]MCC3766489.1 hypothetical protein [Streptomyces sp. UNOC14_S4]